MGKRGMAPLVWIFALTAGAIVMIFLVRFAFSHAGLSETKFSYQDLGNFEANLDLLSQSSSFEARINLPETEFPCINSQQFILMKNAQLETGKIIFSKPQKGSLIIKAKKFNYPYPIATVYFISAKPIPDSEINLTKTLAPSESFYTGNEQLECLKNRLLEKTRIISEIYIKKALLLAKNSACQAEYREIIALINRHRLEPSLELASQLSNLNNELKLNNCPEIW